ncbi:hypothetical protein [Prosthecobacter sp.]|uniref:hypothetical protein n=1 Tax=Prosthecobacter sp. TaxID=1965333 RepID=UPI00378348DC
MNSRSFIAGFITGHSVPGCTGLSQEQQDFQKRSGIGAGQWLGHNFPWSETFPFPERFLLLKASYHNVTHYLRSRRPAFALEHRDAVSSILNRYETILLLAGSCGLELFNNLQLPEALRRRIHIFAYGPVSRRLPEVASHLFVQGAHDWLSRFYHPQVQHRYPCAHMGYLQAPETLRLFNDYHQKVVSA